MFFEHLMVVTAVIIAVHIHMAMSFLFDYVKLDLQGHHVKCCINFFCLLAKTECLRARTEKVMSSSQTTYVFQPGTKGHEVIFGQKSESKIETISFTPPPKVIES